MEVERCSGSIIRIPNSRHNLDALYYHLLPHHEDVEHRPIILRLHGILGNLLDETEHALPQLLAQEGYSSVTINTLLANLGLFFGFGIFDDAMPQIDAACDFLRNLGYRHIVIAGHGLGGCMAIRYAALQGGPSRRPELRGVIAIATAHSFPETVRRRWERFGSEPAYEALYRKAKRLHDTRAGAGPVADETVVVKRAHGHTTLPEHTEIYTLRTWWALAGPEADGTKTHLHIGDVAVPILLIDGVHDDVLEKREGESLGVLARGAGNRDVTEVCLDAGHTFEGHHEELSRTIVDWLRERFRSCRSQVM